MAGHGTPVRVVVGGPGHHDRAERAAAVVAVLAGRGLRVVVVAGLRPRLADDVAALVAAGADRVHLHGAGLAGDLAPSVDPPAPDTDGVDVVVELVAAARPTTEVTGPRPVADDIRAALGAAPEPGAPGPLADGGPGLPSAR